MKGCLAVVGGIVVLIVVAIAGFGGYFGFKAFKALEAFHQDISRIESSTGSSFPFTTPNPSKLDPNRFATAIAIREKVSASLGSAAAAAETQSKEGEAKGFMDTMGEFKDAFVQLPGQLEAELNLAKMSLTEFMWLVQTGHGTIFAAADQGDPRAKELEAKLKGLMDGPGMGAGAASGKAEEGFDNFRTRAKASLTQYDPGSVAVVLACGDRYPGTKATVMVDFMLSEYARQRKLAESK